MPIGFQIFDWSPDDVFSDFLNKKEINGKLFQILECISRQALMRFGKYSFTYEVINSDIDIKKHSNFAQYINAIKSHIANVEQKKRKGFAHTHALVDALNEPPTKDSIKRSLEMSSKFGDFGKDPVCLLERKDSEGNWIKPTIFLEYGFEKIFFIKIYNDAEDLGKAEYEIESDLWLASQKDQTPSLQDKKNYLEESKKLIFGIDHRPPGRYMNNITEQAHLDRVQILLAPDKNEYFNFMISAYISVFLPYLMRDDQGKKNVRTSFDGFVAKKLEYMCKDSSKKLAEIGFDISTLFKRETIKNRIQNTSEATLRSRNREVIKMGLINDDFVKYLDRNYAP